MDIHQQLYCWLQISRQWKAAHIQMWKNCLWFIEWRQKLLCESKIQTDNITVEIKKASEALYNERTIGYVEAKVTVEGKRNDDSFTNKYDLVLLMDYQEDVASVYEVVDIKTE